MVWVKELASEAGDGHDNPANNDDTRVQSCIFALLKQHNDASEA